MVIEVRTEELATASSQVTAVPVSPSPVSYPMPDAQFDRITEVMRLGLTSRDAYQSDLHLYAFLKSIDAVNINDFERFRSLMEVSLEKPEMVQEPGKVTSVLRQDGNDHYTVKLNFENIHLTDKQLIYLAAEVIAACESPRIRGNQRPRILMNFTNCTCGKYETAKPFDVTDFEKVMETIAKSPYAANMHKIDREYEASVASIRADHESAVKAIISGSVSTEHAVTSAPETALPLVFSPQDAALIQRDARNAVVSRTK